MIANQNAYDEIADGGEELPEELRRLKPALLRHRQTTTLKRAESDASWKRLLAAGVGVIVLLWLFGFGLSKSGM